MSFVNDFFKEKNLYHENGYLIERSLFSEEMVSYFAEYCDSIWKIEPERIISEKNGDPYSVYLDQDDQNIKKIISSYPLLMRAMCLLDAKVYVHQIKLNHKKAMNGSEIQWHEDFYYWNKLDSIKGNNLITAAILFDEVLFYNSPLMFIPKSHNRKTVHKEYFSAKINADDLGVQKSWSDSYVSENGTTVVSNLRYSISKEELLLALKDEKIQSFTGKKGDVIFFSANLLHASTKNLSPYDRRMLFITYNDVHNFGLSHERSTFISYNDNTALVPFKLELKSINKELTL